MFPPAWLQQGSGLKFKAILNVFPPHVGLIRGCDCMGIIRTLAHKSSPLLYCLESWTNLGATEDNVALGDLKLGPELHMHENAFN